MDEEEAEDLLRALRAHLAEFGSNAAAAPLHAVPEDGELAVRDELRRVIDEYEAILVEAPKVALATMGRLGARSITFAPDPQDVRFGGRRSIALDDANLSVTLTFDSISEWMEIAETAQGVIDDLRGRLGDYDR